MTFLYLISVCLLAAGSLLLAAREKAIRVAGLLLHAAVSFTALALWRGAGVRAARALDGDVSQDSFLLLFLFVAVCVVAGWCIFVAGLYRDQQREHQALDPHHEPADTPRVLDWPQQPPPDA
jgi:hypothetical protein